MSVIIMGFDPAIRESGIAVVKDGRRLLHSEHISVASKRLRKDSTGETVRRNRKKVLEKVPMCDRLRAIFEPLEAACEKYSPDYLVVEAIFQGAKLGQARGLAFGIAWTHGISVLEVSPQSMKQIITGDRLAAKSIVATAVREKLKISEDRRLSEDESDAIGLALAGFEVI